MWQQLSEEEKRAWKEEADKLNELERQKYIEEQTLKTAEQTNKQ